MIWYLSTGPKKSTSLVQAIETLLCQLSLDDSIQSASNATQSSSNNNLEDLFRKLSTKIVEAGGSFVIIDGCFLRDTALLQPLIEGLIINSDVAVKVLLAYERFNFPDVFRESQYSSRFVGAIFKPKTALRKPRLPGRDPCWDTLNPRLVSRE